MKKFTYFSSWILSLVAIACTLVWFENDLLWKVQQLNLFLFTPLFFTQQMVVSGGLLVYMATFFTQFLFQPWLGVSLLCGWWLLLMWLTKKAFRLPDFWSPLLLIPVGLLLIANVDMGYWLYVLKMRGYFFAPTIGTTIAIALLWVFRCLPYRKWLRPLFPILTVVVGYPLIGIYGLGAAVLMAVWSWRLDGRRTHQATTTILALLAVVAIPLLYYRYIYHQTPIENIYVTGLPIFIFQEECPQFYIPYILLAVCFLLLALTYDSGLLAKPKKLLYGRAMQGILLSALFGSVVMFWFKDENFHHELRMQHDIEQLRWEDVLAEARKQTCEPTRAIVMMRNLALSRLGRQGNEMYLYPNGSKRCNSPFPIYMHQVVGRLIYYQYGMLNECHRMCMEEGVEYGWRVEHLTYLSRCALLSGEPQVVRKYLHLLSHTLYYRTWAAKFENLLAHPEQIAEVWETAPITRMLYYDNRMGADQGFVEKYLMKYLSNLDSDDLYFQEQTLLATLWTKQPNQFWPRLVRFVSLHPNRPLPRHYQEAACLFSQINHHSIPKSLPIKQNIMEECVSFLQQLSSYKGQPIEVVRAKLYPSYGHTYYYDYFLTNHQTYY